MSAGEYWRRKYDELARRDIPDWQKSFWWEESTYLRQRHYTLKAVDMISRGRKLKILDVGCGPGDIVHELTQRGHSVTGIDYSLQALFCAKKRMDGKNQAFFQADGRALPLRKRFDVVLVLGLLGTEVEWRSLIAESLGILEVGGYAIISLHRQHNVFEIPLLPFYLAYFCGYIPESHRANPAAEYIKKRCILHSAEHQGSNQIITRFAFKDVKREFLRNGCRIVDKEYCNWIRAVPLLFNSFFMFATLRKDADINDF